MSPFQTFSWGVVGAVLSFVVLFALPILVAKSEAETVKVSLPWMGLRMVAYILAGGLVALLVGGATQPKHAIAYGVAWEPIFLKGVGEGSRALGKIRER